MKQTIRLRGRLLELKGADIARMVGAGSLARIQAVDGEPFFFQMTLAHEGESTGALNGVGIVKQWLRKTVRAVAHAFQPQGRIPASIYDGVEHWHGNEAERVAVGEIVDARPVEVSGVETARAIGWVYPQFADVREFIRSGARDCCSIEADVEAEEINGRVVVQDVLRGVGVVLGHSSKQTPGFAGARLQKLTEFGPAEAGAGEGSENNSGQQGQSRSSEPAGGAPSPALQLSKQELIAAIKEAGITAADLAPAPAPVVTPPEPKPQTVDALIEGNPFLP